jgi:MoxR-like ATPase
LTTATQTRPSPQEVEAARGAIAQLAGAFTTKVVGQENLRETLLIGLLAGGHILLESVPGLAKTTAARVLADSIAGHFQRIQCTPDLLPSDIIGGQIYDQAHGTFVTQVGPVNANIVLLDEINRSSAKTQSAMLEAMEERQVTIAGQTYAMPTPFLVLATQNPVDQEGTYPLSEAQTDRFMLKETLNYLSADQEVDMLFRIDAGVYDKSKTTQPVLSVQDVVRLQEITAGVFIDPRLMHYASTLVSVTRHPQQNLPQFANFIEYGASPRATIAFCKAARAYALMSGRNHVVPDDISHVAHRVLRHRLILSFEAAAQRITTDTVITALLQSVRVPN